VDEALGIDPAFSQFMQSAVPGAASVASAVTRNAAANYRNSPKGTCGGNSFAAGTMVLMADGTLKPIEEVQLGDEVTATDPESGLTTSGTVTALHINMDEALTDLIVLNEDGSTARIKTTDEHPFWSDRNRQWVNAADLEPGDDLRTIGGDHLTVAASTSWRGSSTMYNLTVDVIHTYYVLAGKTAVLVHNTNSSCPIDGGPTGIPNRDVWEQQNCTCDKRGRIVLADQDRVSESVGEIKDRRNHAESRASVLKKAADSAHHGDPGSAVGIGLVGGYVAFRTWLRNRLGR
jgi:hypothetical protein